MQQLGSRVNLLRNIKTTWPWNYIQVINDFNEHKNDSVSECPPTYHVLQSNTNYPLHESLYSGVMNVYKSRIKTSTKHQAQNARQ